MHRHMQLDNKLEFVFVEGFFFFFGHFHPAEEEQMITFGNRQRWNHHLVSGFHQRNAEIENEMISSSLN